MFLTTLARSAALGVGSIALVATSATAASADAYAPYAQAAAHVSSNGTLLKSKNIDNVTWSGGGVYCVHVSDPRIDLSESVFTATLGRFASRGGTVQVSMGRSECGNDPRTIPVISGDTNGNFAPNEFYLTIQ
ncbi:hypothetical protein [Streptomyces cavernicola]|uniref:Uncharacterized protein n=1 Tax=Streptomyces cavernicola TaxID=3043613 RepID=A0ABT6SLQ1_9ACTN|nr:hypothetical protein [Streptomyces sp. B-S-A6]MDI3408844.1 hypothetical protein [Streptomyces sp. B-S-A6]